MPHKTIRLDDCSQESNVLFSFPFMFFFSKGSLNSLLYLLCIYIYVVLVTHSLCDKLVKAIRSVRTCRLVHFTLVIKSPNFLCLHFANQCVNLALGFFFYVNPRYEIHLIVHVFQFKRYSSAGCSIEPTTQADINGKGDDTKS